MPPSVDDVLTLLYTLIKKPWRVVDMRYELSACSILDHENLMVMETWALDPHLIALDCVSCIRRSCRYNEEKLWVTSIQNCSYSRSAQPKRNKIKSEINMVN